MSKRYKVRKRNAAKLERSREVMGQFYDSVISELERLKAMSPQEHERLLKAANQTRTSLT